MFSVGDDCRYSVAIISSVPLRSMRGAEEGAVVASGTWFLRELQASHEDVIFFSSLQQVRAGVIWRFTGRTWHRMAQPRRNGLPSSAPPEKGPFYSTTARRISRTRRGQASGRCWPPHSPQQSLVPSGSVGCLWGGAVVSAGYRVEVLGLVLYGNK